MRCILFVIVIAFLNFNQSISSNEFKEIKFHTTLSNAVSQVINDFYAHKASALSITKSVSYRQNYVKQMGIINEVLYHASAKIVVVIEDYMFLSTTTHRFYNLIFVDSYEGFL